MVTMVDIPRSDITQNALGGTELMAMRLYDSMPADLMSNFQIVRSRMTEPLDSTKLRILWVHDLANDPQFEYLRNEGWRKFHMIVFVSHWQMYTFLAAYGIPYEKCLVIQNAIEPLPVDTLNKPDPNEQINLIYTPTPHRGLELLVPVFQELCKEYDNLHLDVYSSFKLYGWDNRDEQFAPLFDACEADPKITYHGVAPNDEVRDALKKAHIFAYPSIWSETSCLTLIEAMSAGCLCVHSNLGALYETASNFTFMYQFTEDRNRHAAVFHNVLKMAIASLKGEENLKGRLQHQKLYTDQVYNWNIRQGQWRGLLEALLPLPRQLETHETHFIYKVGA